MFSGFDRMARRITESADRIKLPSRRRPVLSSARDPTKPVLVRGRGLARRRPRSPLSSLFAGLVLLAAFLFLLLKHLG
jgi:hypothetical protein